jgi:hypothetical protein
MITAVVTASNTASASGRTHGASPTRSHTASAVSVTGSVSIHCRGTAVGDAVGCAPLLVVLRDRDGRRPAEPETASPSDSPESLPLLLTASHCTLAA